MTARYFGAAKKIVRAAPDIHAQLRDPFNPNSGVFAENIRRGSGELGKGDDELRESMREFGWFPELPAIQDERGVVLVGHRRLAVANELGIEPVIKTISFGQGDEADAKRTRLALASNIGGKPLSPEDRKSIAEYLYTEREWTIRAIAKALSVSKTAICEDLKGLPRSARRDRRGTEQPPSSCPVSKRRARAQS